jgi:tetratricopeptide (TPR) repeat protein
MYILKILTIFLLISSLNISIANTQSIELRESLKNTKAFYKEGKLKEAINETFKAIKLSKIDFGQEHYYTATLIENLGIIQYESLMYKDAEISFQEVLFIRKKILKEDHTDIAESLNFIALSNRKLQQYDTALNYHNEALLIMSRAIAKSNPNAMNEQNRKGAIFRASAMHTKALIEIKNKNMDYAIGLLKTSSKIFYNSLGKDKSQLIETYKELIKQALNIKDIELANTTKKKLNKLYKSI